MLARALADEEKRASQKVAAGTTADQLNDEILALELADQMLFEREQQEVLETNQQGSNDEEQVQGERKKHEESSSLLVCPSSCGELQVQVIEDQEKEFVVCNKCDRVLAIGETIFSCPKCGHDLCEPCMAQ